MTSPIITVANVSKSYPIYERPIDMLKETITGKKRHDVFWALRDVSFQMFQKDRVGVIGANGSGKSTLLKIITGHLQSTSGSVQVNGNISAMLSLNTVLNPEESGLANIRFSLILNGCPKSQVEKKTEEIIEFTELGPFIYAPVRTYSSGMNAKLAFAITTAIDPDILVIDEVLSVGDAYFMGKATRRMMELCERGNGLLFVSHSTSAVQMLCDKVLWMENGTVRMFGHAAHVIKAYEEDYRRQEDEVTRQGNASRTANLAKTVALEDLPDRDTRRVRLVGENATGIFADTHYVSRISIVIDNNQTEDIPLLLPNSDHVLGNRLDIVVSEWGRLYQHHNRETRALTARTGKKRGGHIVLKSLDGVPARATLEIESCSHNGFERLGLEAIQLDTGQWTRIPPIDETDIGSGWILRRFDVDLSGIDANKLSVLATRIGFANQPSVSVQSVALIANGMERNVFTERVPFEVKIKLYAKEIVSSVDIGLKFTRGDGTYVFWQSSGLSGIKIENVSGDFEVSFDFPENNFGAGDYALTAYAANGWDFPSNYPYSEVYDRKVSCLQFKVMQEIVGLDMGLVNQRATVKVS